METTKINSWLIKYDRVSTFEAYKKIDKGNPEKCNCKYCLNYIAARDKAYPEDFLKMLIKFGVDHNKETEVFYLNKFKTGLHDYGGWFHFVGEIIESAIDKSGDYIECISRDKNISWHYRCKNDLVDKAFEINLLFKLTLILKFLGFLTKKRMNEILSLNSPRDETMKNIYLYPWNVHYDDVETRKYDNQKNKGGPESCGGQQC